MNLMSFFRKRAPETTKPSVPSALSSVKPLHIDDLLPYPHRRLSAGRTEEQLIAEWEKAFEEGVYPLIVQEDEQLMNLLSQSEKNTPDRTDKSFIRERYIAEIENFLMDGENAPLIGEKGETGEPMTRMFAQEDERMAPLLLISVPAERPWSVFRMVPFSAFAGWNACPDAEEIADFCQMMYEDFGALPLLLTGDTLVLKPARVPTRQEAYDLALKTWPFCPDLIAQEYGTVHALADALTRSTVWRFKWD